MEYLLKSVLCLLLLLLFHRLVLQQEVLYRFNRFFLLAAVIGSFLIPLVTIEVAQEVAFVPVPAEVFSEGISSGEPFQGVVEMPVLQVETSEKSEVQMPWANIFWTVYLIGVAVFLVRFLRNLRLIFNQVNGNLNVTYRQETLVLIPKLVSPFSFLKYIFFSKNAFEKDGIPEAVFLHEQCHVREGHSWDVLFIEALLVVFWFHPGLYLARQAVKLNHEFIADQQVIQRLPVSEYQSLLLAILSGQQVFALGSSLNFSLTKKRFEMMKKTSKPRIQVLKLAALVVFLGVTVVFFAEKEAVSKPIKHSGQHAADAGESVSAVPQNKSTYWNLYSKYETKVNRNGLFGKFSQEEIVQFEKEYRVLEMTFTRLSLEDKMQVKKPSFPFAKLTQEGKVIYKKLSDLTEEEKKRMAC